MTGLSREFDNLVKQRLGDQEETIVEVLKERETLRNNGESAKSPDFFQDNNAIRIKTSIKPYTITRIKLRSFFIEHFIRWYQQGRFL